MNTDLSPDDIRHLLKDGSQADISKANKTLEKRLIKWGAIFVGAKLGLYLGIAVASKWARENSK